MYVQSGCFYQVKKSNYPKLDPFFIQQLC